MIEDDPLVQRALRDVMRPEGFEVFLAGDAATGLSMAASDKPDLIVLDVNLPDRNGIEVCGELKSSPTTRHIPVVVMTGEAREVSMKVRGLEAGAEDYLLKPVSPAVLVSRIRALLKTATRPSRRQGD
ncbi:MAG: response regulator transcription factor [Elusimicrobiota bacterium]